MTMIMRSRLRNQRQSRSFFLIFGLFLVVVFGVVFSGTLFRVGSAFISSVSIDPVGEYELLPKNVLASRLNDAERELVNIRYQAALYANLVEENERLTELLSLKTEVETGVGRIIMRPPRTHYDTLLAALGDNDVLINDLALFENFLIGTVREKSGNVALVSLYTAPGNTLDVRVGEPSAIVVAHGLGGGAFLFDVPNEVLVESGDVVTSAAYDTYVVGIVQNVVTDPDRTSKRIYAHSTVSLADIGFVRFTRPSVSTEEYE